MARQTLRDASYKAVGYIDTDKDGNQMVLNAAYKKIGYYSVRTNVTVDGNYRRVGSGNLLVGLLAVRR